MAHQQLLDYIKQCQDSQISQERIVAELVKVGWHKADIDEAFAEFGQTAKQAVVEPIQSVSQAAIKTSSSDLDISRSSAPVLTKSHHQEKKPRHFGLIAVIVVAVVLIGGGAFAYFKYFAPSDSTADLNSGPAPEEVFSNMVDKTVDIKSLTYSLEAYLSYQGGAQSGLSAYGLGADVADEGKMLVRLSGQADFLSALQSLFNLQVYGSATSTESALGVEFRSIGQALYLKITPPMLSIIDLSFLKDQWIRIDVSEEQGGLGGMVPLDNLTNVSETIDFSAWRENLAAYPVFILGEALASEDINGQATYHYSFSVDKAALLNFIEASDTIDPASPEAIASRAEAQESLDKIESIAGEIWIGRDDFLPYKIALSIIPKDIDSAAPDESGQSEFKLTQVDLVISGSNFNQPLNVQAPEESKSVEEALGGLLGGFSADSDLVFSYSDSITIDIDGMSAIDSDADFDFDADFYFDTDIVIDSDNDGLSDQEEIDIYFTDPYQADTDGDGYNDGQEVEGGYDPNGPGKL